MVSTYLSHIIHELSHTSPGFMNYPGYQAGWAGSILFCLFLLGVVVEHVFQLVHEAP
jgi:hypothetical protein